MIAFLLLFLLLETAARIIESVLARKATSAAIQPGWQAEFFKSFLDWHEPDPDLLWRFKPNLDNPLIKTNAEHFLGNEIPAGKEPKSYRILLLGDSSPVGLGLKSRRQAFGEILRSFLETEYAGTRSIELINAAVSGYTSEQIVRFLKLRGWKYRPDLVILYCGNNDASISGILSDRQLMSEQKLISIRKLFSRLAFYRLLRDLLTGREHQADSVQALQVRVDAERYGENLTDIADQCRSHNCPLLILKPPVPRLWPAGLQFKPLTHITGDNGRLIFPEEMISLLGRNLKYCLDRERFLHLYGRGDILTQNVYLASYDDSLAPVDAVGYYRRPFETGKGNPVLLNNLGVSFWQNREYDSADYYLKESRRQYFGLHLNDSSPVVLSAGSPFLFNIGINLLSQVPDTADSITEKSRAGYIYLDSALQADYFSLRIKRDYWRKIDSFAGRKGVTIIDLPVIFEKNGGEKLFIDHCHPTPQGHLLIANAVLKAVNQATLIK